MSAAGSTTSRPRTDGIAAAFWNAAIVRAVDYTAIAKPRISLMVLVTVAIGYVLGSAGSWNPYPLLHAMLGIALVATGSSALNQWLERHTDARMNRTADRPLPTGRLSSGEVFAFGLTAGIVGTLYLAVQVNWITALLTALTLIIYVTAYTPLKRVTAFCTAIGAISGALPPVLGWAAASGKLDAGAWILFGVLFLWQFPHFLAIAWIYRDDYARADLKMLPSGPRSAQLTGQQMVAYALVLLPVSLLPSQFALAGTSYFLAAVVLGVGYLACSIRFAVSPSDQTARGLLLSSLLYLPLLLLSLLWDHLQLLQ